MKKTTFLLLFLIPLFSFSQTINGKEIKNIDVEFVQIVGTSKLLRKKVTIQIDFGQHTKFFSKTKDTQIVGKDGKPISFNSMIDALNFMNESGYNFVQAYAFAVGNQNVYHYLLQKSK